MVGTEGTVMPVRQAGAVYFKNTVKKGWDTSKDAEDREGIEISVEDRQLIKENLVELMCKVPPQIQAQVSETISIIAKTDFPGQWGTLLPNLVLQFQSPDTNVVDGVLKTADSIFMSFRYVERTDELYEVILYSLEVVQEPLLQLFVKTSQEADALKGNATLFVPKLNTLTLIVSLYHSLVYQDLPEFFEDNMATWAEGFAKYLEYKDPALVDEDDEDEPGPIEKLQTNIVDVLKLFVERDDDGFPRPYVEKFTGLVWQLLTSTPSEKRFDQLVVTSMKYLSILVGRQLYKDLFQNPDTLRQIVSNIIIPNLMVRESDMESFDDNPQEFILTELEGADNQSRRRCSRDLLKSMNRLFEAETTGISSEYISILVKEYQADPINKWVSKDTAISLMIGITVRKESSQGVSEVNHSVDFMGFFRSNILPELQGTERPVVKATSLSFVGTFRNQFSSTELLQLLPLLIGNLRSDSVVVQSLAANTIEQILRCKEKDASGLMREKLSRDDLSPFLQTLFQALFHIVGNIALNENQYAMKCIMRTLDRAGDGVIAVTDIVFEQLASALERVCKNPRVPEYNHCLFESLAILVKSVCSKDPTNVTQMENLLFSPFQTILQANIMEFTPYVFQILGQMLEFRPDGTGLGDAYSSLFEPLLSPNNWTAAGNVPGLTRLIQAYLQKAAPEIVSMNKLTPILGIFQKLNAAGRTEASAFDLLNSIVQYIPQDAMSPFLGEIFKLILMKLQAKKKSNLYPIRAAQFFGLFNGLYGGQAFTDVLESIQQGLALQVAGNLWLPRSQNAANSKLQAKIMVIGLTRYACENGFLADETTKQVFGQVALAIVTILTSERFLRTEKDLPEEAPMVYDATFSLLKYASKAPTDPFAAIVDPVAYSLNTIKALSESNPGTIVPIMSAAFSDDEKLGPAFASMMQAKGVNFQ
ncbi:MAG: hypothetical protein SGILL_001225 [Bacillariaceae sp.]